MNQERIDEKLLQLTELMSPTLEEDLTYTSQMSIQPNGSSGTGWCAYKDGELIMPDFPDEIDDLEDEILDHIKEAGNGYCYLKYSITKGEALKLKVCSAGDILEALKDKYVSRAKKRDIQEVYSIITFYKQHTYGEEFSLKNIVKGYKIDEEGKSEMNFTPAHNEAEALFASLDFKITELEVRFKDGEINLCSIPAFPEYGLKEIKLDESELELDESSLKDILAFLESNSEEKISKALEVVEKDAEIKAICERRYLNIIRARLDNKEATLADFSEGILKKQDVELLLGENLGRDYISFSQLWDSQAKVIVDTLGAIVATAINIDEFKNSAIATKNEEELQALFPSYVEIIQKELKRNIDEYNEGWLGELCTLLSSMNINRLLCERQFLDLTNASFYLDEFYFFIGTSFEVPMFIEYYQAKPLMTDMYWLLPFVPDTRWFDETPNICETPLSYHRMARYQVGNNSSWKFFDNPKGYFEAQKAAQINKEPYTKEEENVKQSWDGLSAQERVVALAHWDVSKPFFNDTVDLSGNEDGTNQINVIPHTLGKLIGLKTILINNQLNTTKNLVIPDLSDSEVEHLYLRNTQIAEVFEEIGSPESLVLIDCSFNKKMESWDGLEEVPEVNTLILEGIDTDLLAENFDEDELEDFLMGADNIELINLKGTSWAENEDWIDLIESYIDEVIVE